MKGGIATFVEEIARASHELGQRVEVWAPRAVAAPEGRFPFPIRRMALRGSHDLVCQWRVMREMFGERARLAKSALYLAEPGPILAMAYLQRCRAFKPAKLLLTFHGSEVHRFAGNPMKRRLVSRLIVAADRVTTPSRFTRDLLCEKFPVAVGKTVITPGAPRAGFFRPRVQRIRTSPKIVIVSVGRLHPRKGQLHVIEALDLLPADLAKNVEYWIVGRSVRGDYEARLRRRAQSCQVPVSFHGNIDNEDLEIIYSRADVFAMTSINHGNSVEGFGLAYLEASAFGLPVVGHAVGGVPEAVRHNETGLLVPPEDTPALAQALECLIVDRATRERLGANGSKWAAQHTWLDSAHTLLDGLIPLRARRPRGAHALQSA